MKKIKLYGLLLVTLLLLFTSCNDKKENPSSSSAPEVRDNQENKDKKPEDNKQEEIPAENDKNEKEGTDFKKTPKTKKKKDSKKEVEGNKEIKTLETEKPVPEKKEDEISQFLKKQEEKNNYHCYETDENGRTKNPFEEIYHIGTTVKNENEKEFAYKKVFEKINFYIEKNIKLEEDFLICIDEKDKRVSIENKINEYKMIRKNFYDYKDLFEKYLFKDQKVLLKEALGRYKQTDNSIKINDWASSFNRIKVIMLGEYHNQFLSKLDELALLNHVVSLSKSGERILLLNEGADFDPEKNEDEDYVYKTIIKHIFFCFYKKMKAEENKFNPDSWDSELSDFSSERFEFFKLLSRFYSSRISKKRVLLEYNQWDTLDEMNELNSSTRNLYMTKILSKVFNSYSKIIVIAGNAHLPTSEIEKKIENNEAQQYFEIFNHYIKYPHTLEYGYNEKKELEELFSIYRPKNGKAYDTQENQYIEASSTFPIIKQFYDFKIGYSIFSSDVVLF